MDYLKAFIKDQYAVFHISDSNNKSLFRIIEYLKQRE